MIIETVTPTPESLRLRSLIVELGLPLRRLQDILDLSLENCLAWWAQRIGDDQIKSVHIERLAQLLGINANELFIGSYDVDLARKRILGDYGALPSRYLENPNSYVRTSEHIYKYIVLTRGQRFADNVMAKLNVSPLIYQETGRLINLVYFADLLETLSHCGFSQNELDNLASVIFLSLQDTPLGSKFEESESFFDIYSTLSKNFDYFDSNFEYQSEFVGKKFILKTTLPLNQHEGLRHHPSKIQTLLRYRHILLAWFPYLAGMIPLFPKAESEIKTDCIHTRYELLLNQHTRPQVRLLQTDH